MAETTGIAWTDHSWSPWRGCAKVSPGCTNCYAAALAARFPQHGTWGTAAQGGRRVIAASASWDRVRAWDRKAKRDGVRRTVFPSMCDPFEVFDGPCGLVLEGRTFVALDDTLDTVRTRLWTLAEETENLVWLFLTKRPENVLRMVPRHWVHCDWSGKHQTREHHADVCSMASVDGITCPPDSCDMEDGLRGGWPRNVWIGTTVEDQRRADERRQHMLRIPARLFLSVEPQLEAMDLTRWMWPTHESWPAQFKTPDEARAAGHEIKRSRQRVVLAESRYIDWVIAGGERCAGARPYDLAWPRALRDQCRAAGVPFFFKQAGDNTVGYSDLRAKSPLEDIPADLRIREVPSW